MRHVDDPDVRRARWPASPPTRRRSRELDRAHVFHSWSAQALIDPLPIAGAAGSHFSDYDGKRYLDFSSPAGQRQHRLPAPEAGRGDPGARRHAAHDRAVVRQRRAQRGGPADRRASRRATSTRCSSPTAAPRRPRTRSGWPGCTPAGTRCSPPTAATTAPPPARSALTGDPRRWATEPRASRASCTSGARTRTGRRSTRRTPEEESERALQHLRDTIMVEGAAHDRRDHPRDRSSARTASWCRRPATWPACARSATSTAS